LEKIILKIDLKKKCFSQHKLWHVRQKKKLLKKI
jgi:hypothetical protein